MAAKVPKHYITYIYIVLAKKPHLAGFFAPVLDKGTSNDSLMQVSLSTELVHAHNMIVPT